jgi:hypothetical protein
MLNLLTTLVTATPLNFPTLDENLPEIDVVQTTASVGGRSVFAIEFQAQKGWQYSLQVLSGGGVWDDVLSFEGIDDVVSIPLSRPVQNVAGTNGNVLPTHSFKIKPVQGGGALLHWVSPVAGEVVRYFDSSVPQFLCSSGGYPPFSHSTNSKVFLVLAEGPEYSWCCSP